MEFYKPQADIFVPDGIPYSEALSRTTHLAIGAHQDDLEIFAYHGIAECFAKTDSWFTGVTVTNGAGSPRSGSYYHLNDDQMQAIRKHEQRKAAFVGEYSMQIQLDYPSREVKETCQDKVIADLFTIIEKTRPEILYLHNPADKHDTHIAVLTCCIAALRKMPLAERPKKVYGCEVWRDLDWMPDEDKVVLPTSAQENIAHALIGIFDSQISGGKRYDLATMGRRLANATYYQSHETDQCNALSWAMDLTPLVQDDNKSLLDFTLEQVDRFRDDVKKRLEKF